MIRQHLVLEVRAWNIKNLGYVRKFPYGDTVPREYFVKETISRLALSFLSPLLSKSWIRSILDR
jgi:hypothetical protein